MSGMQTDEDFLVSSYVHFLGHELQSMTITPNTVDTVTHKGLPQTSLKAHTIQDASHIDLTT